MTQETDRDGVPQFDDFDDFEACWNCGGEGYVSNCFEEYACMYPDEGCDLCTSRCDVCRPRKPAQTEAPNDHPTN